MIILLLITMVSGEFITGLLPGVTRGGGVEGLMNATIKLKKFLRGTTTITEVDCVETMFMSPFHLPAAFSGNETIAMRIEPVCRWNFVGTEPCIPTLSCDKFDVSCDAGDSFEVTDGVAGYEKFCGDKKPDKVVASSDLRDLYVKYTGKVKDGGLRFSCAVSCGQRGTGSPLQKSLEPKIDGNCHCGGKPNDDRIVGGETAKKNEFPWLVALVEAKTRQPFCGGSIINDRMILTAGHCFKGRFLDISNVEILVNAHAMDSTPNLAVVKDKPAPRRYDDETLASIDAGNGSLRYSPEEIYVHPLYVSETNDFDVATIKLSKALDFNDNKKAHPICLPELPLSYMRTFGHRKATIAGWGLPGVDAEGTPELLQKLDVNVFMPTECKALYAHRVNRRMLCGGFKEGGKDSCAGDSGGPLVIEDKDKVWYQIGSVSWGDGCAKESNPGVYFRTTESGQWLRHKSNENGAVWCSVPE